MGVGGEELPDLPHCALDVFSIAGRAERERSKREAGADDEGIAEG